jgi:hypothetical protein
MTMETTSREAQMILGRRYGNLAKRPVELNREGKFSAGCEKIPPIEAELLAWFLQGECREDDLTTDDRSNAPYEGHYSISPRLMFRVSH